MRHSNIDAVLQRLADRRIEDAMREGKFDNLAGSGKPVDLSDMPADESARMVWSALRMMRQGGRTPQEARWREEIQSLRGQLDAARTAIRVRTLVAQVNAIVRQVNTMPDAPNPPVAPLELQRELHRLAQRQGRVAPQASVPPPAPVDLRACSNRMCEASNPTHARFCHRCGTRVVA